MNIQKLPSGSYRIQQMVNGRRYSMTVPFKPTQKQAFELINDKIYHHASKYSSMSFKQASEAYRKLKGAVLSPSTLRGYAAYTNNMPESFLRLSLEEIDQIDVQRLVNDYSKEKSPKYVRNVCGFIMTVLNQYMPGNDIHVTLPQKQKKDIYIPTEEDVKRILTFSHDSEYYVALCLACLSLRRSEICALTIDDLEGNVLHINKSYVLGEKNFLVKNTTKTSASTRDIIIPDELADRIRSQGYIYNQHPNSLNKYLTSVTKALGIPDFSPHKLRHFFASYMSGKYTTEQIMAAGGWETDHVLKNTYTHAMKEEEAKKGMAADIGSFLRV